MSWFRCKKEEPVSIKEPKFKALDKVRITRGFYRTQIGILKSMSRSYYHNGDITYLVYYDNLINDPYANGSRFENNNYGRFSEDELELVNE